MENLGPNLKTHETCVLFETWQKVKALIEVLPKKIKYALVRTFFLLLSKLE